MTAFDWLELFAGGMAIHVVVSFVDVVNEMETFDDDSLDLLLEIFVVVTAFVVQ